MDGLVDLNLVWQDYGLDKLEEGISRIFPERQFQLDQLFSQVMSGDILGALEMLFHGSISDFMGQIAGMKNVFIWLLVLGLVSSLMTHFMEFFDRRQVAEMGFYFMYLLATAVLLKCFSQAADTAAYAVENIIMFVKLLVPAYLLSVGVSSGVITAGASRQLMLVVIYGVEYIFLTGLLPLISSYCMMAVVNGIWIEEKLAALMDLLGKAIGWVLKGALGAVTGIGIFQALIAPVVETDLSHTRSRGCRQRCGGACAGERRCDPQQYWCGAASASSAAVCGSAAEDCADCGSAEMRGGFYGNCQ